MLSLAVLLVVFALAAVAFADPPSPPSVDQVFKNITLWIVGIVATVATTFLTIGGLRYLLASGDPGEVEKAKGALRSAGIGYMIAILAPVILDILKSLVGAK
ncbi:pilin [Kitasatospora arboriphila]